ncbi:energy-coupling factor transporter transmembrane component T family protein [Aeromicrobium ginsengisoli]|uniref:Energy-coupling factor transporter transmembrane protein EcfT n=1 Tax=Aeromicrobium ginsengisoli TaxID=363867 RepID=A0A5M4FDV0_9ACTN|nr:energy-coupling factor transporter transmembrane component T [Aeromicrobium ginsengisoli]KAA1396070.1 energy-coupling factor transporter transmembrane protein EcfT [Aeromicrobium ginsengisoli]
MRRSLPLGIYRPGSTIWHRIPAGPKLGLVVLASIAVVALRGPWPCVAALGVALGISLWARVPPQVVWRGLRPFLLVVAILGAFQWWQRGWPVAVEVVATTVALVVVATTFTATTPTDRLLDAIVRGLGPFRRIGVRPEKVALAFSLMITAIPAIFEIAHETREAAKARGLERSVRANLSPMAIRTVAHAYETGAALHARGIGDD